MNRRILKKMNKATKNRLKKLRLNEGGHCHCED